jgi:hypothetical protein
MLFISHNDVLVHKSAGMPVIALSDCACCLVYRGSPLIIQAVGASAHGLFVCLALLAGRER